VPASSSRRQVSDARRSTVAVKGIVGVGVGVGVVGWMGVGVRKWEMEVARGWGREGEGEGAISAVVRVGVDEGRGGG